MVDKPKSPRKVSVCKLNPKRRKLLQGAAAAATVGTLAPLSFPAIGQQTKIRYTLSWLPTRTVRVRVHGAATRILQKTRHRRRHQPRLRLDGRGERRGRRQVRDGRRQHRRDSNQRHARARRADGRHARLRVVHGHPVPANGPIKTPKDLAGKKIGVTAAGGDTPFLPAYCKLAGVDYASMNVVSLDSQIIEQSVINGQVDCMIAFGMSSIPNFITQNFPVRLLKFSDFGLRFYWVNTMARGDYVKKNQELVANAQAALAEGMKWTMLNPEEAVERHMKEHEEIAITKNGKLFTELGRRHDRGVQYDP